MQAITQDPARLHWALYTSSRGNYFFGDIGELLGAGLRELGHTVEFRDERAGFTKKADWHLVIAPHEFFQLGAGEELAEHVPGHLILFNTEQPSTKWFELAARHFPRAAALWDIDFESALRISRSGYPACYLPLGFTPASALFKDVVQLPLHQETSRLEESIRNQSCFRGEFEKRPLDVLFLGHASVRREQWFGRQAKALQRFKCYFHKPTVLRPLVPGQTTNMNTITSVGLAQRSKILLNVHHGLDKYFEWHRIVLLGIAQRALVITEPCSIAPPFQANVHFVEAALEKIPDRIEYFLHTEEGRHGAQAMIDCAYETFIRQCRLSEMLQPLFAQLENGRRTARHPLSRLYPANPQSARLDAPAEICVITPDVAGEGPDADVGAAQVELAELLAKEGRLVTLLHTEPHFGGDRSMGYWTSHFAEKGIRYEALPANLTAPVESSEAAIRSYEVYEWLKQQTPMAVHLPETRGIGFYSLLARRQGLAFSQTRFWVHVHSPNEWQRELNQNLLCDPYELELDFMERECVRRADAVSTSSRCVLDWMEQQEWKFASEPSVRYMGLPPATACHSPDAGSPELVYVGPLCRSFNLTVFLDAIERLQIHEQARLRVTFLGEANVPRNPHLTSYLRQRASKLVFTWQIVDARGVGETVDYLRARSCVPVILWPLANGPLILRHCLAAGMPLIAVGAGSIPELVSCESQATLTQLKPAPLASAVQRFLAGKWVSLKPAAGLTDATRCWLQRHSQWLQQLPAEPTAALPEDSTSAPLVSVCLVHFNRPEYLSQALASLKAQNYPNYEVILVDDGSTRPEALRYLDTLEPDFKSRGWSIIRQGNRYLGAARNAAAQHARGEYLLFMDDDNCAKPHELSTFVRVARRTGADIVTCAMDIFTGENAPVAGLKPKARWIFLGAAAATGAIRNCFGDANSCIRRETFLHLGGFTEHYGITHEDWEFLAKAVLSGCHLETIPEALFWYRTAPSSMIHCTSFFANLQRSLQPYLASVPRSVRGLLCLLQGKTCWRNDNAVRISDYHELINLCDRLVAASLALSKAGQVKMAEQGFLEALQCAEGSGHPRLLLAVLVRVAAAMREVHQPELAKDLVERAVKTARATQDVGLVESALKLQKALIEGTDFISALSTPEFCEITGEMPSGELEAPPTACLPTAHPTVTQDPTSVLRLTSIIILAHNQLAHTKRCLESVEHHTLEPHELILVDNASTDGTLDYFRDVSAKHENVRIIANCTNRGFAAGNNQGIALAGGDFVLLLNNDTVVTAGWLDRLLTVLRQHPNVGIVGPRSNRVLGNQIVDQPAYHTVEELPAFAAEWAGQHAGQSRKANRVMGFCLLARRSVVSRIGGLDEQFGSGNFEDDDFCIRAGLAGFETRIADEAFVHHVGNATFNGARIDYRQAMLNNWALFKAKWGIPADVPPQRGYLTPTALPPGVPLQIPLPELQSSHEPSPDGRCWIERKSPAPTAVAAAKPLGGSPAVTPPPCARVGQLGEARELIHRKKLDAAWQATLAAIRRRPFHPEGYLLLAEIGLAAGDSAVARRCAQHARELAPGWKAPKQFLQKSMKGNPRADWLKLPDSFATRHPSPFPRLSVCIIAKDEERFIEQCLKSVKAIAHQIVLVDTGSTDRTAELAASLGAEVHSFAWCDDFSAARNAALEHATGDWILILDADEELPADQHARLQADLKNAKVIASRLPLVNRGQEADGLSYVPRLFRNAPGAHFTGRIHEQVFPGLLALAKGWGLDVGLGTAHLLHHGYSREMVRDRSKIDRNLRLLKQAVEESPADPNLVMNLGLELVRSGELAAGLARYREAFQLASARPKIAPELREALLTQFTCHLYKMREPTEVVRVLTSPLANAGGLTASLHFALGLAHFELKQYAEAALHLRRCLSRRHEPALSPITSDILTAAPHHCLALSLARLGDAPGAEAAYQAALEETGRIAEIKVDYARFLAEQNRPVEALQRLHEVVAQDSQCVPAWRLGGEIALIRRVFFDFACDWTGEAIRYLPEDPAIIDQRAEVLLLRQEIDSARPLWQKACNGARPPRALAALILCSAAGSQEVPATQNTAEETATSRAFVEWYQRLISAGASRTIVRVNSRVDALRESLPTAARLLESALAEAEKRTA